MGEVNLWRTNTAVLSGNDRRKDNFAEIWHCFLDKLAWWLAYARTTVNFSDRETMNPETPEKLSDISRGREGSWVGLYPAGDDALGKFTRSSQDSATRRFTFRIKLGRLPSFALQDFSEVCDRFSGDSFFAFPGQKNKSFSRHDRNHTFHTNGESRLSSVDAPVMADNPVAAYQKAFSGSLFLLDHLSFFYDVPCYVTALVVLDERHDYWSAWQRAEFLDKNMQKENVLSCPELHRYLAMYDRGLGASDPFSKYLYFANIIEAFVLFLSSDIWTTAKKEGLTLPAVDNKFEPTDEWVVLRKRQGKRFNYRTIGEFFTEAVLHEKRLAVAHGLVTKKSKKNKNQEVLLFDFSDHLDLIEFDVEAEVVRKTARKVLLNAEYLIEILHNHRQELGVKRL